MPSIEKVCCFTGHRPKYFHFRTNENDPDCIEIKGFLRDTCERLIVTKGVTHFISGGAVGVDTWAMEAVTELKEIYPHITLECALPYAGMPDSFAPVDRQRYAGITRHIDTITVLNPEHVPGCMQRRNEYMVNHALYVVAVWTGKRSGTANTIRYAERRTRILFCLNVDV